MDKDESDWVLCPLVTLIDMRAGEFLLETGPVPQPPDDWLIGSVQPNVPSDPIGCFVCGRQVWRSHAFKADVPDARAICFYCAIERAKAENLTNVDFVAPSERAAVLAARTQEEV